MAPTTSSAAGTPRSCGSPGSAGSSPRASSAPASFSQASWEAAITQPGEGGGARPRPDLSSAGAGQDLRRPQALRGRAATSWPRSRRCRTGSSWTRSIETEGAALAKRIADKTLGRRRACNLARAEAASTIVTAQGFDSVTAVASRLSPTAPDPYYQPRLIGVPLALIEPSTNPGIGMSPPWPSTKSNGCSPASGAGAGAEASAGGDRDPAGDRRHAALRGHRAVGGAAAGRDVRPRPLLDLPRGARRPPRAAGGELRGSRHPELRGGPRALPRASPRPPDRRDGLHRRRGHRSLAEPRARRRSPPAG